MLWFGKRDDFPPKPRKLLGFCPHLNVDVDLYYLRFRVGVWFYKFDEQIREYLALECTVFRWVGRVALYSPDGYLSRWDAAMKRWERANHRSGK